MHRPIFVIAALALGAATAGAQGTLSTQGFGYPPGQVSARAQATGGAIGEFDGQSPINPAAIVEFGRGSVYAMYAPEVRQVTVGDQKERSLVNRFPVASVAVPLRSRWMVGLAISSLLDRTWRTDSTIVVGTAPDTGTGTARFGASGAISDVRFALAYLVRPQLRVGVALHALAGRSITTRALIFPDTSRFTSAAERDEFSFGGMGASVGVLWSPVPSLAIAASGRAGGESRVWRNDTAVAKANYPSRAGGAIQFTGITGTTLAVRADWEGWSALADLSPNGLPTFDTWEYAGGAEIRGPRVFGASVPLRVGVRRRTLPFGLRNGDKVTETGVSAGIGMPIASGRAGLDFTLGRDVRSAGSDARERAWTFATGVVVRM